jgi:AraC-like DNA-binding protein
LADVTTLTSAVDGAVVDGALGRPAPPLRPLVGKYVGYRYGGFAPGIHLGLPSASLTIVVSLAEPTLLALDPARAPTGYDALAGGMSTRPVFISHQGDPYGVQLELTPAGARSLLGLPAAALADTVVGLQELFGSAAGELCDRMASVDTWQERFDVLDEVLLRQADRMGGKPRLAEQPPVLGQVWDRIVDSSGSVRVAELASESGWSRRHLTNRFTGEFGLTPKDAVRLARFDRSKELLRRGNRPTVAAVASACGYFDQPHLDREWRDLAGVAPSTWLATEELPVTVQR